MHRSAGIDQAPAKHHVRRGLAAQGAAVQGVERGSGAGFEQAAGFFRLADQQRIGAQHQGADPDHRRGGHAGATGTAIATAGRAGKNGDPRRGHIRLEALAAVDGDRAP